MTAILNDSSIIDAMCSDIRLKKALETYYISVNKYRYTYNFTWLGRPILQHPQDMIAMQEIIWQVRPDVVIETGIAHGGSLIFYSSILKMINEGGIVLGIDIDIREQNRKKIENHPLFKNVIMLEGSSIDEKTIEQVFSVVRGKERILVVLDSNHTHEHVLREMQLYSPLVTKGSYMVVFDGRIEDLPAELFENSKWGKGNNPRTAIWEFLKINDRFIIDTEIEKRLMVSGAPDGYLKCIKE
jgi:cephalosporin hydroxylase